MRNHDSGVTPKQQATITYLLAGKSQKEAAALVGVHENQVGKWMQQPVFVAELRTGQRRALAMVVNRLSAGGSAAVDALASVMTDKTESTPNRLRAADRLLAHYMNAYATGVTAADLADLQRRIEELEAER